MILTDKTNLIAHIAVAFTITGLILFKLFPQLLIVVGILWALGSTLGVHSIVLSIRSKGKKLSIIGYTEAGFATLPPILALVLTLMFLIVKKTM